MSRRSHLVIAGVLAVLGLALLLQVAFSGPRSVRQYVDRRYTRVANVEPALQGALVYTSTRSAAAVTQDIASHWKPADRHADASGYFLRYHDDIVVVAPAATGSRIVVDSEARGFVRWHPFIGGRWGTFGGAGDTIRGGGPGGGK